MSAPAGRRPVPVACGHCVSGHHSRCKLPGRCACALQRHTPTDDVAAGMALTLRPDLSELLRRDVAQAAALWRSAAGRAR